MKKNKIEKSNENKITEHSEYLLLKQKSTPKKIAKILICFWTFFVILPAMYICLTKSNSIKEYIIVKGIYETNTVLMTQYDNFSKRILDTVDISKYTSQIDIPEIKLDKISQTTQQVEKATGALSKLGIKGMDKIQDTSSVVQKQVDKVNEQIQTTVKKLKATLQTDIQDALKKEVGNVASTQVQKQLGLNADVYNLFSNGRFGILTQKGRSSTSLIYSELSKSSFSVVREFFSLTNKYFKFLVYGISVLLFVILLIPVLIVWWIAKKLSSNFTECPYCKKVFLSKAGKFNLLKMFRQ
ncbi:MAG: hypothetical protein E7013_03190 [Alphaproteobacteria bacterium]|nr:hypothetical protein [Alphaproteobacteria bacterium]